MANQRKKGVSRITVTLPDEMLEQIEAEASRRAEYDPGFDRLAYIREAIIQKLGGQAPKSENNE
jgi:metal-responsive CopG/Arc/MetJ family transcriptional regulator